jgi:enterochelin esterase family protein
MDTEAVGIPESPRLALLAQRLESGDAGALDAFWRGIADRGAPLVERSSLDRDALVTFLWRGSGEVHHVVLFSTLFGYDYESNRLRRLPRTDVWYRTYRVRSDARSIYWFSPNDPLTPLSEEDWADRTSTWRPDPLNPSRHTDLWYPGGSDVEELAVSVLEMPDAPPRTWATKKPDVPAGSVAEHVVRSRILGNERRVWVYTPAGYEGSGEVYDLLVVLDGHFYSHQIPTPTILDNMAAAGRIPPLVAVMPDSLGSTRGRELPCYPPFADFLADELLPWTRDCFRVATDPARCIVAGSSFGGLAAAFAGMRRPEAFGNVLSQSGSFWWRPDGDDEYEWLARRFAEAPPLPLRFHLDVGTMENEPLLGGPSQLLANRHLRTVLQAKGYAVSYAEFSGGHDAICWEVTLPEALTVLT